MLPKPRNYAHVSLFAEHVAPVIGALLVNVLILGLMFVTFQYVQLAIFSNGAVLEYFDFWKRVALLVLIMAFAAYNMLAYQTYIHAFSDTPENRRRGRFQAYEGPHAPRAESWRLVLLFVLDLTQVGISACLFAGLVIVDPVNLALEDIAPVMGRLPLRPTLWLTFFGLLTLWHLDIYFWYKAWGWGERYHQGEKSRFGLTTHQILLALFAACWLAVFFLWRWRGDFSGQLLGDVVNIGGLAVWTAAIVYLYSSILRCTFEEFHGQGAAELTLPNNISATAYLVNQSRARRLDVSGDHLAQLWIPPPLRPQVRALWREYADQVYPHDDIELAVRNRFFLDHLDRAAEQAERTFVSLGAGFTSYPFLVARPDRWQALIEVDLPHILRAKRLRLDELVDHQAVPPIDIQLVEADLRDIREIDRLSRQIAPALRASSSFVLFEGVSYYLTDESLAHLFGTLRRLQQPGSILALDYWKPDVVDNPAFARQRDFFRDRFNFEEQSYAFLDAERLRGLDGYQVVQLTDVVEVEPRYATPPRLGDPNSIMPEELAVLVRAN